MSEYNFKKFTKRGSKLGNYSISVTSSYSFGLNSGFYSKEVIKQYKKVVLFYDKAKNAVAFHFTNDEDAEGAFTVVHHNTGTTGSITARSFFIENEINKKELVGRKIPQKI